MPRDGPGAGAGAAAWARRWWRALLAELCATALLVLLGLASLLPSAQYAARPLTHPALAFGFAVTALVQAFGGASGAHMNPAVTLAALLAGRLRAAPAAAYVLAQLLGGVLGYALLLAAAPAGQAPVGLAAPARGVAPLAAAGVEAALTGVLAMVCCALWAAHDARRPDHAAPTKLGLTVAAVVYAGGELTGAAINPARALAPALLQLNFAHHWVYWAGPLGGAALAALLHRWVLTPPAPPAPAAAAPEELPLRDKLEP